MTHSPPAGRPDVTLLVVNYRSADLTLRALRDARASATTCGLRVQEIVVDGASGDGEVERLRVGRPEALVVALPENRGFAAGNNAGFVHARGRHVLMLNPDAFAAADAVARLVRHLDRHPRTGVAAPLLRNEDGSPQDNLYRRFPNLLTLFVDYCAPVAFLVRGTRLDPHNVPRSQVGRPGAVAHAVGAVLLVRREAIEAAGPMDDGFFLFLEETEWQRRIVAAGWAVDAVPDAFFTHLGGGSTGTFALASPHYLDSVARYYPRPRLALATLTVAGAISAVSLRTALALGLGSPRLRQLSEAFTALGVELRRRRRRG
ncbi:glycosyltransferase family 2 protein [Paraconexibacter antarcticus]|uniref:Glycosyltransferase family 2 protein n=1 Tax=Paraconexibacter antarcticus TaxID=2949664 RepID=A0ABY5DSP2_9ACTN|nr:glycosyltransferase family 2 protein [Paraconexibacter antarcticus]UTI65046.1 glycosyltransferase family 2 protein [Paraconexibacter antarcticus]